MNLGVLVPKEKAEIEGKDCGVIDANHRKIGIFTSKEDQNYKRVMSSIRDLIEKIGTPQVYPSVPRVSAPATGLRVSLGMTCSC